MPTYCWERGSIGNPTDVTLFNLSQISFLPVNEADILSATRADPFFGTVLRYTKSGWPVNYIFTRVKAILD